MDNKTFIKIPHNLFTIEKNQMGEPVGVSKLKQLGTEGFTIWSYLLLIQGNQVVARTDIKEIIAIFNENKGTRKAKAKNGLSDARTVKKYLNILIKMEMIQCEQFDGKLIRLVIEEGSNDFVNVRADDKLFISVNPMDDGKGFSAISAQLFFDNVKKMGHIGWSIYCLLYKNHNTGFGNTEESYGNCGFASCSEEYIANIISRNKSTVSEYIHKFPKGLMKIMPQESTTWYDFHREIDVVTYMPNHYVVYAKGDTENKYYINNAKKSEKAAQI